MKHLNTFIFLVFYFISQNVYADGNELLKQCLAVEKENINESFNIGMCLGLGQGVRNTMQLLPNNEFKACFPKNGISNGQATRIIVSYLKKNPAKLHENEIALIIMAYIDAYPCK